MDSKSNGRRRRSVVATKSTRSKTTGTSSLRSRRRGVRTPPGRKSRRSRDKTPVRENEADVSSDNSELDVPSLIRQLSQDFKDGLITENQKSELAEKFLDSKLHSKTKKKAATQFVLFSNQRRKMIRESASYDEEPSNRSTYVVRNAGDLFNVPDHVLAHSIHGDNDSKDDLRQLVDILIEQKHGTKSFRKKKKASTSGSSAASNKSENTPEPGSIGYLRDMPRRRIRLEHQTIDPLLLRDRKINARTGSGDIIGNSSNNLDGEYAYNDAGPSPYSFPASDYADRKATLQLSPARLQAYLRLFQRGSAFSLAIDNWFDILLYLPYTQVARLSATHSYFNYFVSKQELWRQYVQLYLNPANIPSGYVDYRSLLNPEVDMLRWGGKPKPKPKADSPQVFVRFKPSKDWQRTPRNYYTSTNPAPVRTAKKDRKTRKKKDDDDDDNESDDNDDRDEKKNPPSSSEEIDWLLQMPPQDDDKFRICEYGNKSIITFLPATGFYRFRLNGVLMHCTQIAAYRITASKPVRALLEGRNGTILVYGQTGSGKTHTMFSSQTHSDSKSGVPNISWSSLAANGPIPESYGIVPRCCHEIMHSLQANPEYAGQTFQLSVSYVEVYQDQLCDLLQQGMPIELKQRKETWSLSTDAYFHPIENMADVLLVLKVGEAQKTIFATAMNSRSSRSHTIFTVHLTNKTTKKTSLLRLVDLAGSERQKKSNVKGAQFEELKEINKSLFALQRCIFALADPNVHHVPFRESTLTKLLSSSISSLGSMSLIITGSLELRHLDETMSSLRFAERCMCMGKTSVTHKSKMRACRSRMTAMDDKMTRAIDDVIADYRNRRLFYYQRGTSDSPYVTKHDLFHWMEANRDNLRTKLTKAVVSKYARDLVFHSSSQIIQKYASIYRQLRSLIAQGKRVQKSGSSTVTTLKQLEADDV